MRSGRGSRRIPKGRFLLLALAAIGVGASALECPGTEPAALGWLEKMSASMQQVSYNGVVTLQRGDDMQVLQVSHSVQNGTSFEQLTRLTGQEARVVRKNHPLDCIHPGHRLLQVGADLRAGNCGIADHYRFRLAGEGERIAGREAVRVRIEPRDMYRFGYLMELDRETGLLLRAETLGRGDKRLEQFQFASISLSRPSTGSADVKLVHETLHPHPHPHGEEEEYAPGRHWSIGWLPAGFAPTDDVAAGALRKSFTDGLAVFSVFLEELGHDIRSGEGVVRDGGTTSYTRGMQMEDEPVLVTVIGEVPVNTARMVADSIHWVR